MNKFFWNYMIENKLHVFYTTTSWTLNLYLNAILNRLIFIKEYFSIYKLVEHFFKRLTFYMIFLSLVTSQSIVHEIQHVFLIMIAFVVLVQIWYCETYLYIFCAFVTFVLRLILDWVQFSKIIWQNFIYRIWFM